MHLNVLKSGIHEKLKFTINAKIHVGSSSIYDFRNFDMGYCMFILKLALLAFVYDIHVPTQEELAREMQIEIENTQQRERERDPDNAPERSLEIDGNPVAF